LRTDSQIHCGCDRCTEQRYNESEIENPTPITEN